MANFGTLYEDFRVKLTTLDHTILAQLDRDCRVPMTELAERIGELRQSVEYRVRQLVKHEIITGFRAVFNPHRIGFKLNKLYFKLRNIGKARAELLKMLRSSEMVWWMGECSGSWDLVVVLFCRDDYELFDQKNNLLAKFSSIIVETKTETLLEVYHFPKMSYLTGEKTEPVFCGGRLTENTLEKLDHVLLAELLSDARISLTQLAKRLRSDRATVRARLHKLEELGVIIQYRLDVDLTKLGLEMYKAVIAFDCYTEQDHTKLLGYISSLPGVQHFIRNLGNLELELIVKDYHEYSAVIDKLKKSFPYLIQHIDSLLILTDEWTPSFNRKEFVSRFRTKPKPGVVNG